MYLEQEENLREIVVSPDGTLAAYTSEERGIPEIFIRSFPVAGERTPVSEGGGQFPNWSPDGNTLYYWNPQVGVFNTFLAARLRREPTPIVLSTDSVFSGRYYREASDLHPDGTRVIVGSVETAASADGADPDPERFLVITNWFEALRERAGN